MPSSSTISLLVRAAGLVVLVLAQSIALQSSTSIAARIHDMQLLFARAAGLVLTGLGVESEVNGIRIVTSSGAVDVTQNCVGLDIALLLGSAILVYPAPLAAKLRGVTAAILLVFGLNWIRVVSLAGAPRAVFEVAHVYVWPGILIAGCVGAYLFWIRGLADGSPVAKS